MVLNETARLTRVSDGLTGLLSKNSNWNLAHRQNMSFKNQSAFLVWESPSNFRQLFVIPRRGAQ